ncbi:hypothetical protein [Winogradskyella psychrotolerans]|uniref:hypothetical protein n=1 Tax=Winogradskyella psychrotolerans TaxID=1344585 RepID=UPI001C0664B4|nr:hypothetical protein [Winogradskyella psychrotolerans]MBU2927871.1 hypothetical protein [Winogradskyella psychrotolerans]
MKLLLNLSLFTLLMSSCLGDKKVANVAEMNDTSFVNTNFKGNLINYAKGMSACKHISASAIAKLYDVSSDKVHIEDPTTSDRYKKDMEPMCLFYIKDGENDFQWLKGSLNIQREIRKDEMAYDVAKAAGNGEEWEEAWALNKSISKSSEWVSDMGMAAVWNSKKVELKIKFKGYILSIYPIKNKLNQAEVAKNRDYKNVAIAMAKASGFIK